MTPLAISSSLLKHDLFLLYSLVLLIVWKLSNATQTVILILLCIIILTKYLGKIQINLAAGQLKMACSALFTSSSHLKKKLPYQLDVT